MKYHSFLSLAALSGLASSYATKPQNVHERGPVALETRDDLHKRASCGAGVGSCPANQCCSESGFCGTTEDYCSAPQCQIEYSSNNCDASTKPAGDDTSSIPRNTDGPAPYDLYITNCSTPGDIALTFDDGPWNFTSDILDVLKSHDVKATFFVAGNNLSKGQIDDESTEWPSILRRMHQEGHQIGSHTWGHEDLSAASDEIRQQQIIYNEMAFRNIFGFFPKYLRPPYGTCSRVSGCLDYVTGLGYHVVNWNLDTKDYENDSPELIVNSETTFDNALLASDPEMDSFITLSHDTHEQTVVSLLSHMIQELLSKGYRAVTVGECLGDPEENWYVNAQATSRIRRVKASNRHLGM